MSDVSTLLLVLTVAGSLGCNFLMPSQAGGSGGSSKSGSAAVGTAMTREGHQNLLPIATGPHATADCNSCHGTFTTFKQFTCLSSGCHVQPMTDTAHVGIADYKYESAACLTCHPQGLAGSIARADHAQYFPIDMGSVHGASQCADCHMNPADKKQFTCISCHDHAQAVTDTGHVGVANYKYDSPSCLSCHPQGIAGTVSRPDHMKFFAIDVGTKHATTQCTDCHTDPTDKSKFTCFSSGCHVQAATATLHMGVTGYKYDAPTCLTCHPQGASAELKRPDHAMFPIDIGTKHATTQCTDCHTTPGDKSQFTCISCHDHADAVTTPKHANVVGYTYDSPSCYRCHSNGMAKFDHSMLPTPPNCVSCHQAALAMATVTPASMHVANMFPKTCETCHKSFTAWGPGTTMDHTTIGGTTSKCETCHTGDLSKATTSPASMHVANKFPTACSTCHTSFTAWGPQTAMQHTAVGGTKSTCETCHMGDFTKGTTPFNHVAQNVSANVCNTCHTDFTTWNKFVHSNGCYNGTTLRGHQGATCAQCHTVTTDYTKSSCTACHSNRGTNCNGG